MKYLIFVFLIPVSILMGCQQKMKLPETPFTIYPGTSEESVTPTIDSNKQLLLGSTRISNWAMPLPNCSPCSISVDRKFNPDGPTIYISIGSESKNLTIMESVQKRMSLKNQRFEYNSDGKLVNNETGTELTTGEVLVLNDCKLYVRWSEKLEGQTNSLYSDDKPKYKTQLIYQCS